MIPCECNQNQADFVYIEGSIPYVAYFDQTNCQKVIHFHRRLNLTNIGNIDIHYFNIKIKVDEEVNSARSTEKYVDIRGQWCSGAAITAKQNPRL